MGRFFNGTVKPTMVIAPEKRALAPAPAKKKVKLFTDFDDDMPLLKQLGKQIWKQGVQEITFEKII